MGNVIRMLYFVRESYPTFRPDVEVLFGDELLRRGHAIDLVMQAGRESEAPGPHPWHGHTVWVGPTDSRDGALHRLRKHALAVWHDFKCLRAARRADYAAIQVRDKFLIAAFLALTARRRRWRFFFWLSYPEPESQLMRASEPTERFRRTSWIRGKVFGWLLYRWILPRCDHAFVQSEQMRRDVAAQGIDAHKLTAVPMGIAAADVRPNEVTAPVRDGDARSVPAAPLTLGYLGTLNAQRRLEILVEMLALLRKRGVPARLLIVGGGDRPEDELRIERRSTELGVREHVEITGFLPRERALERIARADICLSPFYPTPVLRSTSPTKLVEYMALGLPVVANDHPEQRLVLKESGAGVCVPWGARHFARAVTWLARRSPAERARLGECGRRWVLAHRTYARIADELEQRYLELLAAPSRARMAQ